MFMPGLEGLNATDPTRRLNLCDYLEHGMLWEFDELPVPVKKAPSLCL